MEQDFQSHPSGVEPVCNVTIPVFNRPRATRETILALRRTCAGFPQYYYHGPDYVENLPEEDAQATYAARGIDKRRLHRELVVTDNLLPGKLFLNKILYASGVRSLKPMRRYEILDVADDCRVTVAERKEYRELRRDMAPHLAAVNRRFREHIMSFRPDPAAAQALRASLARHGQDGGATR